MADVERIQKDMTEALQILDSVCMLHNDIGLENMFYSEENGVTLSGFYYACAPGCEWDTDGLYYEPPELFEDRKKGKSDIWSFGIAMAFFLRVIPQPGSQKPRHLWNIKYLRLRRYADESLWTSETKENKRRYGAWLEEVMSARSKLREMSQWGYVH